MDWLKELLKKMGVADTEVDKIDGEIAKELPKHFVSKTQYNEVTEARKKAEKDVTERDAQITELGKAAGLSEELKAQITKLTADNQAAAEKHASELKDLTLTNAIKSALNGKVHDEGLVAGLFDRDKLVVDGDKIVGLDDQLKTLQESKAFLFKSEQPNPPGFHVGGGGAGATQIANDQLDAIFGLTGSK
jgi:hypothetical protein